MDGLFAPTAAPTAAPAATKPAPDSPPLRPPAVARRPVLRPEALHPSLWLGHQLGRHADPPVPSGFAALDAELPGGGWPRRVLTELMLPHPGIGELRLLAPSLVAAQRADRLVMLFDPPAALSGAGLAQLGFDVEQLLIVHTRARVIPGTDTLWALEQALKSGHVGGVIAWLPPRLRAERLRRLQLAAHAHDGPAFVMRETSAAQRPSAAPLRLALRPGGIDVLTLRLLKRRGPPLEKSLHLDLLPALPASGPELDFTSAAEAHGLHAATFVNLAG